MHLPCTHMSVHTHERAHTHAHTHAYICTHMASSLQVFCDGEAAAGSRGAGYMGCGVWGVPRTVISKSGDDCSRRWEVKQRWKE